MAGEDGRTEIWWFPAEAPPEELDGIPFTTGGLNAPRENTLPLPGLAGVGAYREVALLIAALNRAGIQITGSGQGPGEVTGEEGEPRIGSVTVTWETFPRLHALLAARWKDIGENRRGDGWLFAVFGRPGGRLGVSVLFPWRDLGEFMELITAAASSP